MSDLAERLEALAVAYGESDVRFVEDGLGEQTLLRKAAAALRKAEQREKALREALEQIAGPNLQTLNPGYDMAMVAKKALADTGGAE